MRSPVGARDDGWPIRSAMTDGPGMTEEMADQVGHDGRGPRMTVKFFDILERKDLRFFLNVLYLYIIMYINLRALWLLSVLRNYATI